MPSELSVEMHLVRTCSRHGAWAVKGENTVGFPDRIVIAPGNRIVFVETKSRGGRISDIQRRVHRALHSLGCTIVVLWSREEVDKWAQEFFR